MNNTKEKNMDNTNALAELAEKLEADIGIIRAFKEDLGDKEDEVGGMAIRDIDKAVRIVAELAKVSNISQIPMPYWNCKELEALRNCRTIAEEGGAE